MMNGVEHSMLGIKDFGKIFVEKSDLGTFTL